MHIPIATRNRTVNRIRFSIATILCVTAIIGASLAVYRQYTDSAPYHWTEYTPDRVKQGLNEGRVVIVSFWLSWPEGGAIAHADSLRTQAVQEWIHTEGAILLRASVETNPIGDGELRRVTGANFVPVVAIYYGTATGDQILLRNVPPEEDILKALNQAKARLRRRAIQHD